MVLPVSLEEYSIMVFDLWDLVFASIETAGLAINSSVASYQTLIGVFLNRISMVLTFS